jgi:hypothetical protein
MNTDTKDVNKLIEGADQIMKDAQERVLHPEIYSQTAVICGKSVELKPLPIYYAKKWSKRYRDILNLTRPDASPEEKKKWSEEADDVICDAMCESLVMLKDVYEIPNISLERIQTDMTMNDVKAVIAAQAKMNEEDDFLLLPLRRILSILSSVSQAINPPTLNEEDLESSEDQRSSTQDS